MIWYLDTQLKTTISSSQLISRLTCDIGWIGCEWSLWNTLTPNANCSVRGLLPLVELSILLTYATTLGEKVRVLQIPNLLKGQRRQQNSLRKRREGKHMVSTHPLKIVTTHKKHKLSILKTDSICNSLSLLSGQNDGEHFARGGWDVFCMPGVWLGGTRLSPHSSPIQ